MSDPKPVCPVCGEPYLAVRLKKAEAEAEKWKNARIDVMWLHQKIDTLEAELAEAQRDRNKAIELMTASLEGIKADGKTILDFHAVWMRDAKDKIKELEAECRIIRSEREHDRKHFKAELKVRRALQAKLAELVSADEEAWRRRRDSRLKELEAERDHYKNSHDFWEQAIKETGEENKRLREALGWYAPRLWKFGHLYSSTDKKKVFEELAHDSGKRARDALAGKEL